MSRPLRVAVIGCGHMGALHARVVAAHPECALVAAVDRHLERAEALARPYGAAATTAFPDDVDAVVIATPTRSHAAIAHQHLAVGRWCLVEKPMCATLAQALDDPRLVVGHVERFNPAVRAAGAVAPRFVAARRLVPYSGRSADTSVVEDLMVHDLDLVLAWSSGRIEHVDAIGARLRSDDVDVASVHLRTTDGVAAHLLASRVADVPERTVRVYEAHRTVLLDLLHRQARDRDGLIDSLDLRDGLTAQWDAFVDAVRGRAPVAVPAEVGRQTLELAARIRSVMREGGPELHAAARAPAPLHWE